MQRSTTLATIFVCLLAAMSATAHQAGACSTFCFQSQTGPVFGKNYDWDVDDGLLIVNKRGVSKVAMTGDDPARWTSRFGSVTFNQYGRELPCGGMNEAGLVVELMWLDSSEYPQPDRRSSVTTLQWIQYQLDNCANVAEVLATDERIRIARSASVAVHYLVADASGACASVEFISGKMVAHTGSSMPLRALTNSTYEQSLDYARRFAGTSDLPRTNRSLDRFVRAAHMAQGFVGDASRAVIHAFGILSDVGQGDFTKWSIVYDVAARRVHFKTYASRAARHIHLGDLDFDCSTPTMMLGINAALAGDLAAHFIPYERSVNLELIESSFRQTDFLRNTPRENLVALSQYPDGTTCAGTSPE